jgi:hypothetical protein
MKSDAPLSPSLPPAVAGRHYYFATSRPAVVETPQLPAPLAGLPEVTITVPLPQLPPVTLPVTPPRVPKVPVVSDVTASVGLP